MSASNFDFAEIKTVEDDGSIVYDLTLWMNKEKSTLPAKKKIVRRKRRNQLELHMDLHNRQAKIRY